MSRHAKRRRREPAVEPPPPTFRAMPFDGRICPLHDEAAEALRQQRQCEEELLRQRQLDDRVRRHRERLIGQGSLVERIADDRRTYGGGPREIRT